MTCIYYHLVYMYIYLAPEGALDPGFNTLSVHYSYMYSVNNVLANEKFLPFFLGSQTN